MTGKRPFHNLIVFCDFPFVSSLDSFHRLLSIISPLLSSPLPSSPLLSSPLQADISLILGYHAFHPSLQSSWGLINRHAVLMFYCLWKNLASDLSLESDSLEMGPEPVGLILPIMGQNAKCTIWLCRVHTRSLCINEPSAHLGFGLKLVPLQI